MKTKIYTTLIISAFVFSILAFLLSTHKKDYTKSMQVSKINEDDTKSLNYNDHILISNEANLTEKEKVLPKSESSMSVQELQKKEDIIKNIKNYISDKTGTYGIYYIDITTGDEFGINEDNEYIAASTVKVPVNLYLYDQAAKEKIDLDEQMQSEDLDYEEGTGSIQGDEIGKSYSLNFLSKESIEESDNIAVNMLIRRLGWDEFHDFEEVIVGHQENRIDNISNPKDMALYLKYLINFAKEHPKEGNTLIDYMENTIFNDRIPLYLPENIKVAHKIGNQVGAVHDVGIVYTDKPYIICIMSQDVNEDDANEVVAHISKMIFDYSTSDGE